MSGKGKNKHKYTNRRKRQVVGKEEKYRQERDKSDKEESGKKQKIFKQLNWESIF